MGEMRSCCARLALLATLLAAGCGGGSGGANGAHSYVGSTPDVVLYVTWNRDGDKLTGTVAEGELDDTTHDVQTNRASFTGTVNGSAVSLDLRASFGGNSALTGTLNGDALSLEYLQGGQGVVTVQLKQAGAGVFNAALTTLSDQVEQSKADAQSAAAETGEKQHVADHAQVVQDDIAALKLAVGTAVPSPKTTKSASDLTQLQRDLQVLRDHAQAAQRADKLSACSSAANVQSDLSTLEGHVAAQQNRQTALAKGASAVNAAIAKLREDYLTLQSDDPHYLPPDPPTQKTVGRAIQQAGRKLRKASSSGGGAGTAIAAILKEARSLNVQASTRCRTGA